MEAAAFFATWRRLLALEREAGRGQFEALRSALDPGGRIAKGLAVGELFVTDTAAGALGRAAWELQPKSGELSPGVSAGDPVRVYRRREPSVSVRGLVSRRTRRALVVVFDEPPELEDGELVVEREYDETSHRRLSEGLSALESGRGRAGEWRELLLGSRKPRWNRVEPVDDAALNAVQREAVARALSAEDVALVHGPPGTGKTQVLAAIAQREIARGGTVLACAASNAAVDNLVARLASRGLDPVRLGHPARVHPDLVEHTLEARAEAHEKAGIATDLVGQGRELIRRADRAARQGRASDRFAEARFSRAEARRLFAEARRFAAEAEDDVLSRAKVVGATLTGLKRIGARRFSLVVVDEATQATLPATVLALLVAERAVLAGDPQQLPPTVLSVDAAKEGLSRTLYERLNEGHPALGTMLEVQHRMHAAIMRFPSDALYGGRLVAHPSVAAHTLEGLAPLLFVDSAGKGWSEETPEGSESQRNPGEAARVAREVRSLLARGVAAKDIGVVAPYSAQVQLLRSLLPGDDLDIDTVDAFQGREKEAIVVSLTRSNDAGELGFCADVRRMNVALTRARRRLVVVGDSATVGGHPFYEAFVRHVQEAGAYLSAWEEEA